MISKSKFKMAYRWTWGFPPQGISWKFLHEQFRKHGKWRRYTPLWFWSEP